MVTVCPSQFATRRTLFHVLVGCGLLMLKVSRLKLPVIRSEERFSRNAETDLVCRLLLEKKKRSRGDQAGGREVPGPRGSHRRLQHEEHHRYQRRASAA